MKKFFAVLTAVCLIFACGCTNNDNYRTETLFYFNAPLNIILPNDESFKPRADGIKQIVATLNDAFDPENENSDVYKFNALGAGESVTLTPDVKAALETALHCRDLTGGAFNPFIYPLADIWGFTPEKYDKIIFKPPTADEIAAAKELCGAEGYTLDGDVLTKNKAGVKLDLGGIAKGYAADRVNEYLKKCCAEYGYVDFGSSSSCFLKYTAKTPKWNLGIKNPKADGLYVNVPIADAFVSTSGDYERFYDFNGTRYCHVIDSATGAPIANNMHTATVIAESAAVSDALSTALLVMGAEKAESFVKNYDGKLTVFFVCGNDFYTNATDYTLKDKTYTKNPLG